MRSRRSRSLWLAIVLSLTCPVGIAYGHPGHTGDFEAGWQHPLMGVDHLLSMIAVGLLAFRVGGRGLWLVPAVFLSSMLLGGMAAAIGVPLPGVEFGVIASVFVLGALVAATQAIPARFAVGLVAVFAFFHGHAHAAEMLTGGSLVPYAAGLFLSTALMLSIGITAGLVFQKLHRTELIRLAGGAIAAAGLWMLAGSM